MRLERLRRVTRLQRAGPTLQYDVDDALLVADQNKVCMYVLPITNARNDVRPLLLDCCAEAAYVNAIGG